MAQAYSTPALMTEYAQHTTGELLVDRSEFLLLLTGCTQHVMCVLPADRKWGQAYLTREFFQLLGEAMPEQVLLVMAEEAGRPVAGALNLIGSHALFGRNWGCAYGREIKHLHFEVCYYQVRCAPSA